MKESYFYLSKKMKESYFHYNYWSAFEIRTVETRNIRNLPSDPMKDQERIPK